MSAQSQIFNPTPTTSQASGEGFSCPALNTASRLAIVFGPSDRGMMVYDTTLANVLFWNGVGWVPLGGGGGGTGTSLNTQVLFNDFGVVNGDTGLIYNKTLDALTVSGIAISKGNISVDTTNTAIGNGASNALVVSSFTTAVGRDANNLCTAGNSTTAVGYRALATNILGNGNTAVGVESFVNVSGDNNTAIGYLAGNAKTAGNNCGFFGNFAQASAVGVSNEYTYGDTNVLSHRFANGNVFAINGDITASNGRLNSRGASAALRTASLTAEAFITTVSVGVGVVTFFSTITIAFTLNNNACTGIIDCQFAGFNQVWGDFLFSSNQSGIVATMRSAASAGVTGLLTITGSGTSYTLVITCPTTVQFPSVNLRVSSGGGAFGGSAFTTLPTVTFA
jgi:hypothetical protein